MPRGTGPGPPCGRSLPPVGWWLLTARLGAGDDVEALAARLWSLGAAGVAEVAEGGGTTLSAGFGHAEAAHRALARLAHPGATIAPVDEHGWVDPWRRGAEASDVGSLVVRAPWHRPQAGARLEVVIDPGPAFGHGGHPTTRLVLGELADLVDTTTSVLDVGCGSGVLAVAAAALGAARVVAVDTDPDAVAATRANAQRNGVRLDVGHRTVAADLGRFDVVVANLLAPVLCQLAPDLVAATAPHGRLVVAGLLSDQRCAVTDALRPLAVRRQRHDGDWALLELSRVGPTTGVEGGSGVPAGHTGPRTRPTTPPHAEER
jgi:ribosomal protein L11 methyltransferase